MNLTEWQVGTVHECPVCQNIELEIDDLLGYRYPNSAWIYKCTKCEQRTHIVEGIGADGQGWISRWRLVEPISELLHERGNVEEEKVERLAADLILVNEELISYLAKHPELLYEISPRKFEELVAELLQRMGYEVELTPYSKDGGWDVSAIWKSDVGHFLTLVQCKRYRPDRPIGIEHVRNMIGLRDIEKASYAMIATTSSFTAGARELQLKYKWQLDLHDYTALVNWLRKYSS